MDDEVEDLVGDVKYTDSQKSVTTSAVYSFDFTDSSPDRNTSSGKETYVIERDDSDDSELTFGLNNKESVMNLTVNAMAPTVAKRDVMCNETLRIDQAVGANIQKYSIAQETFTQTSKTIFELAHSEIVSASIEKNTLQTQTSFLSITENRTLEYKIHVVDSKCDCNRNELQIEQHDNNKEGIADSNIICTPSAFCSYENTNEQTLENLSSSIPDKNTENTSVNSSDDKMILFIDDEENADQKEMRYDSTSEFETSKIDSDIEDDSLMETEYRGTIGRMSKEDNTSDTSEMQKSIDNDVEELYNKLAESPLLSSPATSIEPCVQKFGKLTPLTEESIQRKGSILDLTPSSQTLMSLAKDTDDGETLFVNNAGVKIKVLSNNESVRENEKFKLPPIHLNKSGPNSPHLNFLFSLNASPKHIARVGNLPCVYEGHNEESLDHWDIGERGLASGESPLITGRSDSTKVTKHSVHLPPIHFEGAIYNNVKPVSLVSPNRTRSSAEDQPDAISINGRIKELKMLTNNKTRTKYDCRSYSPTSNSSREDNRLSDVAERGCDNLCLELLRRLRSPSWVETTETLEHIPKVLEKHWSVMAVTRIADLLRQVIVHVESPRSQVARSACATLADILKNTNFTRKPDFYEAISILLTKTGSFSRPVRRAANVALDDIVCSVDLTHSVTALCVYGAGHKSALVRCAAARLMVVCCALAEGGRRILRARPPSAAAARRHVLRALAELLHDKNVDTRKYAERIYSILRPLPTFEAYFLTDVDAELAARHMKKYDAILINSKQPR